MKKGGRKLWKRILGYSFLGFALYMVAGFLSTIPVEKSNTNAMPDTTLLKLSEEFLYKVKTESATGHVELSLAQYKLPQLISGLNNNKAIKTFWVNIYNAWYQVLAVREKLKRPGIFTQKLIPIAGKNFSLDDIEHGILRKYRWKYSMGYLPKFFPGKLIKQLAVSEIDYRIHFALNCGAKSCPPIAFYTYDHIDKQLELATKSFLDSETEFDDGKKEVLVTKLMDWFRGDFDGKHGIKKIIKQVLGRDVKDYTVKFNAYSWDEALHNFDEDK